jgi:multiple sugar transport system substrate-binding protein
MKAISKRGLWSSKKLIAAVSLLTIAALTVPGVAATAAQKPSSITVFLIPSPTADAIKARIPEFEKQSGIKVKTVDTPYDSAHQKMLLSFQSKKGSYDVVQFDNPYLAPFASQNALASLDSFIKASKTYDIKDFVKPLQEYGKYSGKTYGLNLSTEPLILWYRTDIYSKLGLNVPKTWAQYLENAQKIQQSGEADGQVIANNSSVNSWWWLQFVWSFGGDLTNASGKVIVNNSAAVQATNYMKSLLAVSPKSAITANGDDATTLFTTQNIGQMINYSGYAPVILDPKTSKSAANIAAAPIPVGKSDITELTGWNIGIPADSKKKEAGWQFLDWLLSKENTPKLMEAGAAAIGRTSIVKNPAILKASPYIAVLGPASVSGRRLPALTTWGQISFEIGTNVQDILTDKTTTKAGLDKLAAQLTKTMKKK